MVWRTGSRPATAVRAATVLPTPTSDEHLRAQHPALTSSASDCATSWPDGWLPMGGGRMLHMLELAKEG